MNKLKEKMEQIHLELGKMQAHNVWLSCATVICCLFAEPPRDSGKCTGGHLAEATFSWSIFSELHY